MGLGQWITGISHLGIPTFDIDRAAGFYIEKLGFRLVHRKIVVDTQGRMLEAAFLQLGNLVLELFKPPESKQDMQQRQGGVLDHFALDAPDFDACVKTAVQSGLQLHASTAEGSVLYEHIGTNGVRGINFIGPSREVIEYCHDRSKQYQGRSGLSGWSHLALKVRDLEQSTAFYKQLGFQKCADGYLDTPQGRLLIVFVELNGFQLELIQTGNAVSEKRNGKYAGVIDHFALEVKDIQEVYYSCRKQNFRLLTPVIKELSLFEHGVRYVLMEGPDHEVVELCQTLKW